MNFVRNSGKILGINFFDPSFGYKDFEKIKTLMPWIVKFTFEGEECAEIEKLNLFEENA